MFDKLGPRMYEIILRMNIPIEDLPWVDGRLNVYKLLTSYLENK